MNETWKAEEGPYNLGVERRQTHTSFYSLRRVNIWRCRWVFPEVVGILQSWKSWKGWTVVETSVGRLSLEFREVNAAGWERKLHRVKMKLLSHFIPPSDPSDPIDPSDPSDPSDPLPSPLPSPSCLSLTLNSPARPRQVYRSSKVENKRGK